MNLLRDVFSKVERLTPEQVKAINEKGSEDCNCTYGPHMHVY